jgi:hypothetical protein
MTMTKETYKTKTGTTQFRPVFNRAFELAVSEEGNLGFCLACGKTAYGVEPDARRYKCESCEMLKVYGLEELVMMGLAK